MFVTVAVGAERVAFTDAGLLPRRPAGDVVYACACPEKSRLLDDKCRRGWYNGPKRRRYCDCRLESRLGESEKGTADPVGRTSQVSREPRPGRFPETTAARRQDGKEYATL